MAKDKIADISQYQGSINWDRAAEELQFCILRASVGRKADTMYAQNAAACAQRGIPFHAYHYLKATTTAEAEAEAAAFYEATAHTHPIFFVVDCEDDEITYANTKKSGTAQKIVDAFVDRLRMLYAANGVDEIRVAAYIGHHVYKKWALDTSAFDYIWIPRYGDKQPDYTCDLWQFTSKGSLSGVGGNVDLNRMLGSKPPEFFMEGSYGAVNIPAAQPCNPASVIEIAKSYVGYLEKKSDAQLDDFTANAGSRNYTKFNRDYCEWMDNGAQPMQWCAAFVSTCFVYAYGLDAARALLCGDLHCYTPTGAKFFKDKGRYIRRGAGKPQAGDVVFFYSSAKGRIGHVGIVYKVSGSKVYTVEGNTSGANTLITNGGGVRLKSYSLNSSYIDGYGRPDYAGVTSGEGETYAPELGDRVLKNGMEGDDVRALQEALISLGYDCGRYGADGEFGDGTELALISFQEDMAIEADGVYGQESHGAMRKALEDAGQVPDAPKIVRIEGGNCWVRSMPSTAGKKLGVAHEGDRLTYGGETSEDGWLWVQYANQNGWVSGKYGRLMEV